MTVSTTTSSIVYTGTGSLATYPYTWSIAQSSDLIAYTIDAAGAAATKLVNGTDYAVAGAGIATGGTVTLAAGNLASGARLFIASDPLEIQSLLLQQGAAMNPGDIMAALDLLTREVQANRRLTNGSIQIPTAESLDGYTTTLPTKAKRASQFVSFDSNGNVTTATGSGTAPVSTAMAPVVSASTVTLARNALGSTTVGDAVFTAANAGAGRTALGNTPFSVATVAALKALTSIDQAGDVLVEGYYATEDGGGGLFRWNSADATADNGGTIVIPNSAPGTGRWHRLFTSEAPINVRWFGAKGDGATDDAAAIQACVTYASGLGRKIYAPASPSQYLLGSGITATAPVHLFGDGNGAGPGSASQLSTNTTTFMVNFANAGVFTVTTRYPSTFRDFQINVNPGFRPQASGYGIKLIGDGTTPTVANAKIENVSFNYLYRGIHLVRCAWASIRGCYFGDWVESAIYSVTDTTVEASTGFIRDCFFFGQTASATQTACIYLGSGYCIIDGNEILGAQCGIKYVPATFDAGFLKVVNNTIEENSQNGVYIGVTGSVKVNMVDISHNEFSAINQSSTYTGSVFVSDNAGTKYIKDISICDNISRHSLGAGNRHYWIGAGENVRIAGNVMEELGSNNPTGIQATGSGSNAALGPPFMIQDNIAISTSSANFAGSAKYSLASNPAATIRDMQGMAFASLPTNTGNGSQVYVTDGLRASNPLTAASTGAIATRLNNVWSGG